MPDITIEVDEFVSACSNWDIKELIEELKSGGHLSRYGIKFDYVGDTDFDRACEKLKGNEHNLPKEVEEFIINLAKRF